MNYRTLTLIEKMDELQFTELDKIDAIVKTAVAEAIEKHRLLDQSISIWKDGEIVTLSAEEIPSVQKTKVKK